MKKYIYQIAGKLFLLAGLISLVASCKKDDATDMGTARLFMPSQPKISTGETSALITWTAPVRSGTDSLNYTVEVATDSTFQTIKYSQVTDTTGVILSYPNLSIKQNYVARIKANAYGDLPESKWFVTTNFKIPGAEIFSAVTSGDVVDNAVRLTFQKRAGLTRIMLKPATGASLEVALTTADIAAGSKIISGLLSNVMYTAEIFKGDLSNGTVTFTTKAPISGNIIDLRGITDRPLVLNDTLALVPNGSTVVLKRGYTYEISTPVLLSKSVKVISGSDITVAAPATISITGGQFLNVVAGSAIEYIDLEDLYLRGDTYSTSSGKYVMNINVACTIGRVSMTSCKAEILRGFIRTQAVATIAINNLQIDKSIINDIGGYGFLTVDAGKVENISIKNSTVYNVEKLIVSKQNSTSVLIENSTLNAVPLGSATNYLIDYSTTYSVTGGITLKNSILGPGKLSGTSVAIKGIRVASSPVTPITVENSYKTSDFSATSNDISGLISAGYSSAELFTSPSSGNFKYLQGFAGSTSSGDPRWRSN